MNRSTKRALLFGGAGASMLLGSWAALSSTSLQRADVRAGDALRRSGSRATDQIVIGTTDLGSLYAVAAASSALGLLGRRQTSLDVACVGALAWALSQSVKTRVRRVRPYEADGTRRLLRPPTGSSFPSGHACVAAALSAVLASHAQSPKGRVLLAVGPYVAATRVYAGVHYPTDVIGGAGLGYVISALWRSPSRCRCSAGLARPCSALQTSTTSSAFLRKARCCACYCSGRLLPTSERLVCISLPAISSRRCAAGASG